MKHYLATSLPVLALSAMSMFVPNATADEWDKRTNITIDRAISVEGAVLPAGSYVLRLAGLTNRGVVQIFNAQETRLLATVFAVPAQRYVPADNSEFKFYESEGGEPPAVERAHQPRASKSMRGSTMVYMMSPRIPMASPSSPKK